jgi:hypothetical protein
VTDPAPLYGDYYREIYAKGMLAGEKPALPMSSAGLERAAAEAMDERANAYVYGGAGSEDTMRANLEAFRRWRIVPRVLRDLAERDLSTTVLGTEMPAPVMLAPIGVQKILHDEGELLTARAAAELGLCLITSTASSYSFEQIAEANGDSPRWFQLYWPNEEELAASFVSRAEAAGYSGSWSRSTTSSPAGSRATSSRPTCRRWRESGSRTTSPTRSSRPDWRSRRRRTWAPRSAASSACSQTPR